MSQKVDYEKIEKTAKARRNGRKAVTYAFLTLWGLIVLFPFYWMILTSVKSYSAYNSEYIPKFFTLSPTMQNYIDAFTTVPLDFYCRHHGSHALCDDPGGLCFRQTGI